MKCTPVNVTLRETRIATIEHIDPLEMFANACANHSETLCGTLIEALLSVENAPESDVEAVVDIIKALHAE